MTISSQFDIHTPQIHERFVVDFGQPEGGERSGIRRAVVVSTDAMNEGPVGVLVIPLTSTRRGLPSHVEIESGDSSLDHPSWSKSEDMKSVSLRGLIDRLGEAGPEPMFEIGRVLRYLLDL